MKTDLNHRPRWRPWSSWIWPTVATDVLRHLRQPRLHRLRRRRTKMSDKTNAPHSFVASKHLTKMISRFNESTPSKRMSESRIHNLPGVNFINVLLTAFALVDPESINNIVKSSVSFYAFGIYGRERCSYCIHIFCTNIFFLVMFWLWMNFCT